MALPLLPEDKLVGVFSILEQEIFDLSEIENELIKKLKFYYKRTWIVGEKEFSIFSAENSTNNGAETYHKTLKTLSDLSKIILDYEIEYQRLEQGLQITRKLSKKNIENAERRNACKDKLQDGTFSTTQYLNAISLTIGHTSRLSQDDSINELFHSDDDTLQNICLICCQQWKEHLHSSLVVMQIYAEVVDRNLLMKICTVPSVVVIY